VTTHARYIATFKAALRTSTPLVGIESPNHPQTISTLSKETNGRPLIAWDTVRGFKPLNEEGHKVVAQVDPSAGQDSTEPPDSVNGTLALVMASRFPAQTILFLVNAHRQFGEFQFVQALSNLRDQFKANSRMVICLMTGGDVPAELTDDLVQLREPLPVTSDLEAIIVQQYGNAKLKKPDAETLGRSVSATIGMSAYPAEQAVAMSLTKKGIDLDALWARKVVAVNHVDGLRFIEHLPTEDDIAGLDNARSFYSRLNNDRARPSLIVWIDEVEKAVAGNTSDSSGTTQKQIGSLLTDMQETRSRGVLHFGQPGGGKSLLAKTLGSIFGVPVIAFDLAAMQGSLVGETTARTLRALDVIHAMGGDDILFVATCNAVDSIPSELRSRFSMATFFFDLPTDEERAPMWTLYAGKHSIDETRSIDEDGWTGREVEACCRIAYEMGCSIDEASTYVVPIAKAAATEVESRRRRAAGTFVSASYAGAYQMPTAKAEGTRAIKMWGD